MAQIKSIEQLLHFMKREIQLSRYDANFIENIANLKQVTTNQVVLFHDLLDKYRRQFAKHELYPETLVNLPWNVTVVESSPKFTHGHVEIVDNTIFFKCPFNRKFITSFRQDPNNRFVFDNVERRYHAPYSNYSLKILLDAASKHFDNIHYCNVTQKLLDDIKPYTDVKYWNPTLVNINDRLYIVAMNNALYDALGDIELNTEWATLNKLASYGIDIDSSLYDSNDIFANIAANHELDIEISDIDLLVWALSDLGCDMVYIRGSSFLNPVKKKLVEELTRRKIKYTETTRDPNTYNFPVYRTTQGC